MTPRYCYIQLTPLPKVPSDETKKEKEVRCAWFRNEVDQFKKWANVPEGDTRTTLNIATGFPTKFLIQCSYNPEGSDKPWDKALDYFIQDIFSACVYGDVGATVDGESFCKRARWSKKIKGNWSWKSSIGVATLGAGGVSLKQIAEYPPRPTYTTPMEWWAKLLIASVILLPIVTVLFAFLSQR